MTVTITLDDTNTITLPDEISILGWGKNTVLDIDVSRSGIVTVREHGPQCRFCGDRKAPLVFVKQFAICENCLDTANLAQDGIRRAPVYPQRTQA